MIWHFSLENLDTDTLAFNELDTSLGYSSLKSFQLGVEI